VIALVSIARVAWVFSVGAALIGCDATGSQPGTPYPVSGALGPNMPETGAVFQRFERIFALTNARGLAPTLHADRRRSWMRPGAAGDSLLYVSSVGNGVVDVYDYKTGEQEGGLSGLQYPYGQCVDPAGDIYVTQFFGATITEYAHGGTSPIKTLKGPGFPIGCSVDPSTGNLAVSSWVSAYGSSESDQCGGVWIYPDASGTPTLYTDPNVCQGYWPPGYDPSGNLFVEADGPPSYLDELAVGGDNFTELSLVGATIHLPTSVMWAGSYLVGGDQEYNGGNTTAIYKIAISGSTATVVKITNLTDSCSASGNYTDVVQPFILDKPKHPKVVLGGNLWCSYRFDFWKYAKGKKPVRTLSGSDAPENPYGQSISSPRSPTL
jgi:hypothetical protein